MLELTTAVNCHHCLSPTPRPLCRAQVNGVLNKAGVKRGQVRPQIVSRLHEIANAVLPPPLAAIVNLTDDPYPQALLDTAVPQMYRAPCPPVPPILSAPSLHSLRLWRCRSHLSRLCDCCWHVCRAYGRIALIGDAAFTARPTTGAGTTKAAINGAQL